LFSGWGFAPDPTGGAQNAPQTPLLVKGGERRGGEGNRKGREGKRGEFASS